ncbi:hypothetical protein ACFJ7G_004628, partial [Salmonella enterica]
MTFTTTMFRYLCNQKAALLTAILLMA